MGCNGFGDLLGQNVSALEAVALDLPTPLGLRNFKNLQKVFFDPETLQRLQKF